MESRQDISRELVEKFLQNRADESERSAVIAYIRSMPEHDLTDELFIRCWEQVNAEAEATAWPPLSFQPLHTRIRARNNARQRSLLFARVAASLLLLLLSSWGMVANWQTILDTLYPIHYISHRTAPGQQLTLDLPDGSHVVLNAGSVLRYPDSFRGDTRMIYLEGEAFFKVVRNEEKPFIVRTGQLRTRVLGTSFNIHAYPGESRARVDVLTGKVQVAVFDDSVATVPVQERLLTFQQQVSFYPATRELSAVVTGSSDRAVAWTEGRLSFHKATLDEVAATLQRWYSVPVDAAPDTESECTFTAVYREHTPLRDALEMLSFTGKLSYTTERTGRVVLRAGKCSPDKNDTP